MEWVAAVAAVIATAIPVILIGSILADKKLGNDKLPMAAFITVFAVIAYFVANAGLVFATSAIKKWDWEEDYPRPATFTEAQEASEFTSGYEYPLVLGDRGSVSYSKEEFYHGLFYFRMTSQSISGSSILVSYEHADGVLEVIEIPISMINFRIVDTSEDTSLVIDLGAINAPVEGYTIDRSCNTEVVWGWWVPSCEDTTTLIAPGEEGVAGLLQRAFAAAPGKIVTMTVTQEQFNHILGAMESS